MAGAAVPPLDPTPALEDVVAEAVDWAIGHGLVVRPPPPTKDAAAPGAPPPPLATHAPISLVPTPFPRAAFEHARALQPAFNRLVHAVSRDRAFLDEVVASLAGVDDFTARLHQIYVEAEAHAAKTGIRQPVVLGLHRSDYLLHAPSSPGAPPVLQQVELNTIASSFSSLSAKVGELHRYLVRSACLDRPDVLDRLPPNAAGTALADGIATAWALYQQPRAVVVMVVQPNERNAYDQRWIQDRLTTQHGIHVLRCTLAEIARDGKVDAATGRLFIRGREVAVAYFRAGYGPADYPTDAEWAARLKLETSLAIKCPTAAYQLAGMKKVQQVLARPGALERFVTPEDARLLRSCFTGLYPLDGSPEAAAAIAEALARPRDFVLKPQREGGGNNFYNDDVARLLRELSPQEQRAYILMDRIRPPEQRGWLLRGGHVTEQDVVSELGIYGVFVSNGDEVVANHDGGHLVRSKGANVDEGGVAAGFAHLDSPLLV